MPLSKIQDIGNQVTPNIGRRNFIINGALDIDQRHNFATFTTETFLGDRLNVEGLSGGGGATMQVVSDAPDVFPNGKSGKVTVTGTDTSLASSDFYTLRHIIEGKNSARLGFGTSNAKTCTLSFYVKSSLTGTFCVAVGNGANNRGRPFEYTINSANTWERKTILIVPDTSGTYLTTNGRGIQIRWAMAIGSNRHAALGSYSAQEVHGTSNQTNLFATNSATFQITGLQFEEGNVATEFEHRSFGEELALCERYYQRWQAGQTYDYVCNGSMATDTRFFGVYQLSPDMRDDPTMNFDGTFKVNAQNGDMDASNFAVNRATKMNVAFYCDTTDANRVGNGALFRAGSDADAFIEFISEL